MKIQFLIILFFVCLQNLSADVSAQRTPEEFLLTAFEDLNTLEFSQQIDFLERRSYQIPLGEELEFRYSNDERTYSDARYQLRFRPSNPWRVRRNNALFNARKEELTLRQKIEFNENLYDRYARLTNYLFSEKKRSIAQQKLHQRNQLLQLFEGATESDLFDARDYVDAKLQLIEALEDYDQARIEVELISQEIKITLETDQFNWKTFELVTIATIEFVMADVLSSIYNSAELEYLTKQIEVANLDLSTEKADFDIGFVQAEYAPFRGAGETDIGFSFGITLPIFRNNKAQIAERTLDAIQRENEFISEQYQDSLKKVLESRFLEEQLSNHKKLLKQVEELDLSTLQRNLATAEDFDPISLLELQEGELKLNELVLRSYERLIEQYLEFLFTFDALATQPLKNYLANELTSLE